MPWRGQVEQSISRAPLGVPCPPPAPRGAAASSPGVSAPAASPPPAEQSAGTERGWARPRGDPGGGGTSSSSSGIACPGAAAWSSRIPEKTFSIIFPVSEALPRLLWQPGEVGLVPLVGLLVFPLRSPHRSLQRKSSLSVHTFFNPLHETPFWAASVDGEALEQQPEQ